MTAYHDFLKAKVRLADDLGFEVEDHEINPLLKPHQRAIVRWACRGGRRAIYGGDEAEEINARTGCIGCPLASEEKALETILAQPRWEHLAPLRRIKPIWRELRQPQHRLRKAGVEILKDGSIGSNPQRMGPLTFAARLWALNAILAIQADCNSAAAIVRRPGVDIINSEEEARIRQLIADETWPNGWDGDEPMADTPLDTIYADGAVQPLLFG
jgi:DNA sulfur modification protein DndC